MIVNPEFPTFTISGVTSFDQSRELLGTISSDSWRGHQWVADKWIGSLLVEDSVVFGRWHQENDFWKLILDPEYRYEPSLSKGQRFALTDGFWGERVELVIDKSIPWEEVSFEATEKLTHHHCFFCWAQISIEQNTHHMVAQSRQRVCQECFDRYVEGESFGFIQYPDSKT